MVTTPETDSTSAFTDSETEALFDSDFSDQFHIHLNVIARHAHLNTFRQRYHACNVSGSEIELRSVVVEETGMTPPSSFFRTLNLAMELGVRKNGAGFAQNLFALDISSMNYHGAVRRMLSPASA